MTRIDINQAPNETVLLALTVAVLAIAFIALCFGVLAVVLRMVKNRQDVLRSHMHDLWMEPVLDAIADPDGCPFRHAVRRGDRLLFLEFLSRLSLMIGPVERDHISLIAKPYLPEARRLLRDSDAEFRALGVQLIGLLGADEHRKLIVWALKDKSPLVVLTAIRSMTRTDRDEDIAHVLKAIPRFESWGTTLLTTLLAGFGTRAIEPLRKILGDPTQSNRIRIAACGSLHWLNDFGAADVATDVIMSSPDRELEAACLRLVRRLGTAEHANSIRRLVTDHDPVVRLHAVSALATLDGEDGVDLMTMSVSDPSRWVAIRAAKGLVEIKRQDRLREIGRLADHPRADLAKQFTSEGDRHA